MAGAGFEPAKAYADAFTVRSHWPLGQPAWDVTGPGLAGRQRGETIAQRAPRHRNRRGDNGRLVVRHREQDRPPGGGQRAGQTAREIATRFDFKGTGATIEWQGDEAIEISASADDRASAVLEVFKQKLVKRDVSLKVLDACEPRQSGQVSKIGIALKEGISSEDAKKISKLIRDEGPKGVKAQIQGDELRVSSKKRDDLQAIQALVRGQDYDFAVQFTNYR